MVQAAVSISFWRQEPGDRENANNQYLVGARIEPLPRGWYCQVRTFDPSFAFWLKENCPSSQFDLRWNNGDQYYSVYIQDDREAELFQLRWS